MQAQEHYGRDFYEQRYAATRVAAEIVLELLFSRLPGLRTVVDFGCGVGTWLKAAESLGADDVLGIDGPWVERDLLVIPQQRFAQAVLPEVDLGDRRFDLAISLEVAEHLHPEQADLFVDLLCAGADLILFSAAVPGQPGTGHVNCQWPAYWADKFARHGYVCLDIVRPRIWQTRDIPYFYQQNTLVYVNQDDQDALHMLSALHNWCPDREAPWELVHRDLYEHVLGSQQSLSATWKQLRRHIKRRLGMGTQS